MTTCKGHKKDGTSCRSPIVLDDGYCLAHRDQALLAKAPEEVRWTRQRLEAAIAAHGGPEGLNLAGADLSNLNLHGMDLRGIVLAHWDEESEQMTAGNLQEANLIGANLQGAQLAYANLHRAKLASANLQGANLARANLHGVDLVSANLQGASLFFADLQGANLMGANLQGARLSDANLQGANLNEANLQEARLAGANLQGASLFFADLQGSTGLLSANLQGVGLRGANLQSVVLGKANLREVDLSGANLQRANLFGADLQGANLSGADLRGAILRGASLQEADLRFAILREVDLLDVREGGLRGIKLYRAELGHTVLNREQLGRAIEEELPGEYRKARETYLALKRNFESLGDYEAASWSYIRERQMERACSAPWRARRFYGKEQLGDTSVRKVPIYRPRVWWFFVRHTARWLSDWPVEWVCGYGERPWRTVATMLVVFAASVATYWATWGVMKVVRTPETTTLVPTRNLMDLVIFSLGALTTMAPKGLEPRADWVQFIAGFEALLGIGLTGLLGFVLGNRIRRS